MIILKIELHSAITGKVTEIGRMTIANDGTSRESEKGNYIVKLMRKGTIDTVTRTGEVKDHRRLALPIWDLVSKALKAVGW